MREFSCLCTVRGGVLKLYNRDLFQDAIRRTFGDGEELELILREPEPSKTRAQERGFHAMISPWARDEGHTIEDLKRDLLREIFGEREHTNALTGAVEMVLCEPRTSALSKQKYNELIERTLEIAARMGYVLVAPSEYRERHEQARRPDEATA